MTNSYFFIIVPPDKTVARKSTYTIHAVLTAKKPYEVRFPKEDSIAENQPEET